MNIIDLVGKKIFQIRYLMMKSWITNPVVFQKKIFKQLVNKAYNTEWGITYEYSNIYSYEDFVNHVPVSSYEDIAPFIERMMNGEQNILWGDKINLFAKSSGTTNSRSKFIPVSNRSLYHNHFRGGEDMLALYLHTVSSTRLFSGKHVSVGGSFRNTVTPHNTGIVIGDISALMMHYLPRWATLLSTPSRRISLMSDWEEKSVLIAQEIKNKNITSIAGVPTWTVHLCKEVCTQKNTKTIFSVWPNLEVFFHGGVSFVPYRTLFESIIDNPKMRYVETYNASEGFFGIQDDPCRPGELLLLVNHGIFYEFLPVSEDSTIEKKIVTIENIEIGKTYALIISTESGLWRYQVGDTVRVTSISPIRISVVGRTKQYINVFGEELMISNAEQAITLASEKCNTSVADFTVGPIFMNNNGKGGHEWIVEFSQEPENIGQFIVCLDTTLREINSDYDAKRVHDMALQLPVVHSVKQGTFYEWLKSVGKTGGQHKVPRLSNDRYYLEQIIKFIE